MKNFRTLLLGLVCVVPLTTASRNADAIALGADFVADYTFASLGSISGLPNNYGGLVFKAGDPNTILIGGAANGAGGGLYEVPVTRDGSGHIVSVGAATLVGPAPYNDGGFAYGPGGVLFLSQWPINGIAQYLPGSTAPDKTVDLNPLGVAGSHAALQFVPAGFAGAGQLKGVSWSGGQFYTFTFTPDGLGTYDITAAVLEVTIGGGPEGFVYISGANAGFGADSILVSEYSAGTVGVYEIDANGNPILATRRDFLTDLTGAEGAAIDPLTGDFLFSTFGGGSQIVVVQGFIAPPPPPDPNGIPEPGMIGIVGLGLVVLGLVRRRRSA